MLIHKLLKRLGGSILDNEREDLINKIKDNMPNEEQIDIVEKMAEKYKDKSEDDIFVEIIRMNKDMEEGMSPEKYKEILDKLDTIRPMLTSTQRIKLDLVLKALKKEL